MCVKVLDMNHKSKLFIMLHANMHERIYNSAHLGSRILLQVNSEPKNTYLIEIELHFTLFQIKLKIPPKLNQSKVPDINSVLNVHWILSCIKRLDRLEREIIDFPTSILRFLGTSGEHKPPFASQIVENVLGDAFPLGLALLSHEFLEGFERVEDLFRVFAFGDGCLAKKGCVRCDLFVVVGARSKELSASGADYSGGESIG